MEPEELRARIAANIRRLTAERGLSLNQACDLAGLTRSAFFRVLNGKGGFTTDSLAKISEVLEVEPAVLLMVSPAELETPEDAQGHQED